MTAKPDDLYMPETRNTDMGGHSVLMITGDGVEDLEFFYPFYRFTEAGFRVDVATPNGDAFKGKQGLTLKSSLPVAQVAASDYQMLYLPGGKAPATLRDNKDVITLVKNFAKSGKIIAAICHGPQILAAADIIGGKKIAGWPEIENEISGAGATYVNEETVQDGQFITARWPADLPAHMKKTLELADAFARGEDLNAAA